MHAISSSSATASGAAAAALSDPVLAPDCWDPHLSQATDVDAFSESVEMLMQPKASDPVFRGFTDARERESLREVGLTKALFGRILKAVVLAYISNSWY